MKKTILTLAAFLGSVLTMGCSHFISTALQIKPDDNTVIIHRLENISDEDWNTMFPIFEDMGNNYYVAEIVENEHYNLLVEYFDEVYIGKYTRGEEEDLPIDCSGNGAIKKLALWLENIPQKFTGLMNAQELYLYNTKSISEAAFAGFATANFGRETPVNIKVVIPDGVTTANQAFVESGITELVVPGSITQMEGIVVSCVLLKKLTIKDGLTVISDAAFQGCQMLDDVTIPASVRTIGYNAFNECIALDVTVPDAVTTIGADAFGSVPHITYHGTATGSPWGALSIN